VEIRSWPLSPSSDFLDEFSKRQLTKYIGQSTRKLPQAGVGRYRTVALFKSSRSVAILLTSPVGIRR
jgi:hypothetical protein